MLRYGVVDFGIGGERGAMLQHILLSRLNAQGVVTIPMEDIDRWYDEDRAKQEGCTHRYVLHDGREEDIFRTIMESREMQDEHVTWRVRRFIRDKKFIDWVKSVEKKCAKKISP